MFNNNNNSNGNNFDDFFSSQPTRQENVRTSDVFEESFQNTDITIQDLNANLPPEMSLPQKIIYESCGRDEQNNPNAAITVTYEMFNPETQDAKTILQQPFYNPEIHIEKHFEFIQVDILFTSYVDMDLKAIWNTFEKYGTALNDIEADSTYLPSVALTIVPVVERGEFYIVCLNPLFWSLQSSKPGKYPDCVRIQFKSQDVGFYQSDEIEMQEIEAHAQRNIQQQEANARAVEKRRQEKEQEQIRQNQILEDMRRNIH